MKHNKRIRAFALLLAMLCVAAMMVACKPVEPDTPDTPDAPVTPDTPDTPEEQGLHVALDLTEEWDKVSPVGSLVQGCLVIRKEFAEQNPLEVAKFLEEYKASVVFLQENVAEAAQMIAAQGIFAKAPVAQKAIHNCNITYLDGANAKAAMSEFLNVMIEAAPASIGGALPADDFYYTPATVRGDEINRELTVNVAVLSGTTGFGMAQLMQKAADGEAALNYNFKVEAEASNITAALIKGDVDIAALPTNAAATLYNKTQGKIQLLAINTRGVLYLLDNGNGIESFADLKGKTVYVPAQNPTFIFKYLCEQNGLTAGTEGDVDVIISNKYAAPAELQQNVAAGTVNLAVLPEPMVTIALTAAAQAQK
jgi:ABC-type nitrate/sulfonate/bicarbonate transport system substrate-binding protein